VLQCVAVCCSVLQCVAVCCSVLQCVAVCCSVLQFITGCCERPSCCCVAVCCSLLQSVAKSLSAIRMSMLQYVRTSLNLSPPPNNLEIVFCGSLRISGRHRIIRKKSLKDPFRLEKKGKPHTTESDWTFGRQKQKVSKATKASRAYRVAKMHRIP